MDKFFHRLIHTFTFAGFYSCVFQSSTWYPFLRNITSPISARCDGKTFCFFPRFIPDQMWFNFQPKTKDAGPVVSCPRNRTLVHQRDAFTRSDFQYGKEVSLNLFSLNVVSVMYMVRSFKNNPQFSHLTLLLKKISPSNVKSSKTSERNADG